MEDFEIVKDPNYTKTFKEVEGKNKAIVDKVAKTINNLEIGEGFHVKLELILPSTLLAGLRKLINENKLVMETPEFKIRTKKTYAEDKTLNGIRIGKIKQKPVKEEPQGEDQPTT